MSTEQTKFILDTMEEAGLTASEMINLLPIGRVTFYNWKRGEPIGDKLRYKLTIARCQVIAKATALGRFPLPTDTPKEARAAMIANIMVDVRQAG